MCAVKLGQGDTGIKLKILGYQFPDGPHKYKEDLNWLVVRMDAASPGGTWHSTEPMLTTSEVELLARWLESLAQGNVSQDWLLFTEPNVIFRCLAATDTGTRLQVYFWAESRPPWVTGSDGRYVEDTGAAEDDLPHPSIEFNVSSAELQTAAADLRSDLARWPPRYLRT